MATYNYTKTGVNLGKLEAEIAANVSIGPSVTFSNFVEPSDLEINFDADLSGTEQDALDSVIVAHPASFIGEKNYRVKLYSSNKLESETWYHTDNGDGTYSDIVEKRSFIYSRNELLSEIVEEYWADGTIRSSETWNHYSQDDKHILKKQGA